MSNDIIVNLDTIDYTILVGRLSLLYDVLGMALYRFTFYLNGRHQRCFTGDCFSSGFGIGTATFYTGHNSDVFRY